MKKLDIKYGITIYIDAEGPGVYILGHSIKEALNILAENGNIYDEMKWNAINILYKAQECNANLREIQSIYEMSKLRISFEFESWEDFIGFKTKMEEHSQQ